MNTCLSWLTLHKTIAYFESRAHTYVAQLSWVEGTWMGWLFTILYHTLSQEHMNTWLSWMTFYHTLSNLESRVHKFFALLGDLSQDYVIPWVKGTCILLNWLSYILLVEGTWVRGWVGSPFIALYYTLGKGTWVLGCIGLPLKYYIIPLIKANVYLAV